MRSVHRSRLARVIGAISIFGAATMLQAQGRSAAERVQYVRVGAQDYAFEAPATLSPGVVTFHLVNDGADVHQLTIVELGVGHTLKEFFDTMRSKNQLPAWTAELGMTPTIQPRAEAFLTVRLAPGRYILTCLIPAKDGHSHSDKGMSALVTVSPTVVTAASEKRPVRTP